MKYIIASHGSMASGIKNTLELLIGKNENIIAYDAYIDNQDFSKDFSVLMDKLANEDCVYVFTDVISGSVTQVVSEYLNRKNIYIITGVNLPLILEIVLRNDLLNAETINKIIEESKTQMIFLNQQIQ